MVDAVDNLEERIALARRNLEDLTEQATGVSGAASEDRIAARIAEQQDLLDQLLGQQKSQGGSA